MKLNRIILASVFVMAASIPVSAAGKKKAATAAPAPKSTASTPPAKVESADQGAKGNQDANQPLSETVQGEVKEKLDIQKSPPSIELNVKEIIESGTTQTDHVLQAAKPIPSESDFAYAGESFNSTQAMKPWMPLIPEPPLVTFQTGLSNVAAKNWEFRVSDQGGDVVKIIQGKGMPPYEIEWNGLNERGEYITVGTLYSYQFVTYDENGNANTFPGEPFQLDALMYKQKGKIYVEFSNKKLFMDDLATFRPTMDGLWKRALDVVRENSNAPLTVEVFADSVKSPLAEQRRQTAVTSLSDSTLLPAIDIHHKIEKITDRGDILRLVMSVK